MAKKRSVKVYGQSGYKYRETPTIMLKGQWLKEAGFDIGDYISVTCEDGKLVIVFDEYEVAPGSAGMPHFTIEPEVLDGILRQPSLLSQVGKETA